MQGMGGHSFVGKARTEDVEVQVTSSLSVVFCRSKKISDTVNNVEVYFRVLGIEENDSARLNISMDACAVTSGYL
jgi:hypothetical protein